MLPRYATLVLVFAAFTVAGCYSVGTRSIDGKQFKLQAHKVDRVGILPIAVNPSQRITDKESELLQRIMQQRLPILKIDDAEIVAPEKLASLELELNSAFPVLPADLRVLAEKLDYDALIVMNVVSLNRSIYRQRGFAQESAQPAWRLSANIVFAHALNPAVSWTVSRVWHGESESSLESRLRSELFRDFWELRFFLRWGLTPFVLSRSTETLDSSPQLLIAGDPPIAPSVNFDDRLYDLEISAIDSDGLRELTVANHELGFIREIRANENAADIDQSLGNPTFLSESILLPIAIGANTVLIKAIDILGNETETTIKVNREPTSARRYVLGMDTIGIDTKGHGSSNETRHLLEQSVWRDADVRWLAGTEATRQNFDSAARVLQDIAGPNDQIVFFFQGAAVVSSIGSGFGLVAAETRPEFADIEGITAKALKRFFTGPQDLIILDVCGHEYSPDEMRNAIYESLSPTEGTAIVTTSNCGEPSALRSALEDANRSRFRRLTYRDRVDALVAMVNEGI